MSYFPSSRPDRPALSRLQILLCAVMAFALLASPVVVASTASNTTIGNIAMVNYNDGAGSPQPAVSASASAAVTLLPSAPNLSSPVTQMIAQGSSATLTYFITGTANGPDTYSLSAPVTPTNASAVTASFSTPIVLGGTTLAAQAVAGNTSITVPYDGNPSNTNVNGATLPVGSVIVVGGNLYTIASIVKNSGANTAVVGLTAAISGATVAVGTIVGEQKTFTVTVPSGTIASGGSGSQSVSLTATSVTAPNPATTQATPTVITVNRPTLDVDASITASQYDALTDGLLTLRYLFGLTGSALTNGALGATATRTDPMAIKNYLDGIRPALDVDGDGNANALTDGLLIIRYLFGLRGAALITGAVSPNATRVLATDIEIYIQSLIP